MNLNPINRFAYNPINIDIKRSTFSRNTRRKMTFNTGELIPFYVDEVLPGDTFNVETAFTCRMSTPIHPVMDDCYIDMYYFFVPNRLIFKNWKALMGENVNSYWVEDKDYFEPAVKTDSMGFPAKSLADYMGVPTEARYLSVNMLPFRAYTLIYNEWFRDQNTQAPVFLDDGMTDITLSNSLADRSDVGMKVLTSNKYHDYFTSALQSPQKGDAVTIPLGNSAPVKVGSSHANQGGNVSSNALTWSAVGPGAPTPVSTSGLDIGLGDYGYTAKGTSNSFVQSTESLRYLSPDNLYADMTGVTGATINALRYAFAIQRLFEKDARGGTRYIEIIKSHFNVTSSDARLQRPEYLGGKRSMINVSQVVQTSSTDDISPQGNTAAYSLTNGHDNGFTKSFEEHGFVIGVLTVRTLHSYQQGLAKMWSRRYRFDHYFPALANIGEQPIYNKELYAYNNNSSDNNGVFGFQEAWAEYRYNPSLVTSAFRSNYQSSLDIWHYADYFTKKPVLNSDFMKETKVNVDRTLAVSSSVEDQFICDVLIQNKSTRPMPLYSIPGLLDHF